MSINEGDLAEMAMLIEEQNRQKELLDKTRTAFKVWRERAFKAREAGRMDLYEEAEQMALDAKNAGLKAKHEIERLDMEKDVLRNTQVKDTGGRISPQARAAHSLNEFKEMGVDPNERILYELGREQAADDELAALKAKLGKGDE